MPIQKSLPQIIVLLAVSASILFVAARPALAQEENILHNFNADGEDGVDPNSTLVFDGDGNLYGTTWVGGTGVCSSEAPTGCGMVFELSLQASGSWTEKSLHNFNGTDGANPNAGLIFDADGNLYGTTVNQGPNGGGTAFELKRATAGGWHEKLLHSFGSGKDGAYPFAGLTPHAGSLYGTTTFGGAGRCDNRDAPRGCGTVFELTPATNGTWMETVYSFTGPDGNEPDAGLIFDAADNLYGTTQFGGTGTCRDEPVQDCGTVFELTPKAGGGWTEKILFSFTDPDGTEPIAGLMFDASGKLYGTTESSTAFELTPAGDIWTESVIFKFDKLNEGRNPFFGSLIFDAEGNLYGTTRIGGAYGGGTVFELTPQVGGVWSEKVLHHFRNDGKDGFNPYSGLILDAAGNLYGTTSAGGTYGGGTVFEIKP
jgi:uncharacterized repeat protein (TIGR03803 family)